MKKWSIVLVVLLIALTGCRAQPSPAEILAEMEAVLNSSDVDAAMAFFADDAVVKLAPALPPGSPDTYSGVDAIHGWFEALVADNFEIAIEVVDVDGDTVTTRTSTWLDTTRQLGVAPLVATETYTIRGGKIRGFTWAISDESLAKVQAAMAPPSLAVEDLIGIWKPSSRVYLQFNGDGTYRVADAIDFGEDDLAEEGRFGLEGTLITFTYADDAPSPWAGESATYQAALTPQGELQFTVQEDPNSIRKSSLQRSPWSRVPVSSLPPTPTAAPQPTPTLELVTAAITDLEYLVGVWQASDGRALQFVADGTMLVSESLAGLSSGQAQHGECWFDGSLLTLADADGSGEGSYAVELRRTVEGDPVSLKLRAVEDPFVDRREILTKRVWSWIKP